MEGFLEAVWGIVRLQEEKGIDLSDAIDEYRNLLEENEKLLHKQDSLRRKCLELEEMQKQLSNHVAAAKKELKAAQSSISQGKEELASLAARAESEKKQLEGELEECRQKASVTAEEIKTAVFQAGITHGIDTDQKAE